MPSRFRPHAALLCSLVLSLTPTAAAAARSSCGAGYITEVAVNQDAANGSATSTTNITFRLDNSLRSPDSGVSFYTDTNGKEWIVIDDVSKDMDEGYSTLFSMINAAFLAGSPITVSTGTNNCLIKGLDARVNICSDSTSEICQDVPG